MESSQVKKALVKIITLLLTFAAIYCGFQGRLVWLGILFLIAGSLALLTGFTYGILVILGSFLFILIGLFGVQQPFFWLPVALVMVIVAFLDLIPLLRLMRSGKHRKFTQEQFYAFSRENEVVYKLWKKLKGK